MPAAVGTCSSLFPGLALFAEMLCKDDCCVEKHRAKRNSIAAHEMAFSQLCSSLNYGPVTQHNQTQPKSWLVYENLHHCFFHPWEECRLLIQLCKLLNILSQVGTWENHAGKKPLWPCFGLGNFRFQTHPGLLLWTPVWGHLVYSHFRSCCGHQQW